MPSRGVSGAAEHKRNKRGILPEKGLFKFGFYDAELGLFEDKGGSCHHRQGRICAKRPFPNELFDRFGETICFTFRSEIA